MTGLSRAFVNFVLVVVVFAAILAIGSRVPALDYEINLLKLVLLLAVSAVALVIMWKKRKNPNAKTHPLQIAWFPKR